MNKSLLLRFILVFSAISVGVCGTTFWLLKKRLGLSKRANLALFLFISFIALIIVVGPITYRFGMGRLDSAGQNLLQFLQYFLMGWVGVNFLVLVTLEILQAAMKPFDPQKRMFLSEGLIKGILAATTTTSLVGLWEANAGPSIAPVKIFLPTLPTSFHGLRMAQISDIHIGPLLHHDYLEDIVAKVMSLNADIILITGDLVDGTVTQLKEQVEPLKKLKAREGVYFCTGNHEFYSGAAEWCAYLESLGIHVFRNSNVILKRPGAQSVEKLMLAGVYDWHAEQFGPEFKTDPALAATSGEKVDCRILLAHNPYSIEGAASAGFHFQISGHTHAGQFYPFAWIVKLHLKHFEGLYQINPQTQLYVNRGTGYWGPPNRLGKRSEITHFTLVNAESENT